MELILLRHTSVAAPKGTCYGATDVDCAETFVAEATESRKNLNEMLKDGIKPDAVFTSPLKRARMLAEFCGYPDAVHEDRIREFNFGEWEMKSYDDLYANVPEYKEWCMNYITQRTPGGECVMDQVARFNDFADELKAKGYKRVIAFCHGGILVSALIRCGKVTLEDPFSHVPPYGSVIKVEI